MYRVETTARFDKEFKKLDRYTQKMIANWIEKRSGSWRYRIGDYRLICEINDNELIILALTVGHRREIYIR